MECSEQYIPWCFAANDLPKKSFHKFKLSSVNSKFLSVYYERPVAANQDSDSDTLILSTECFWGISWRPLPRRANNPRLVDERLGSSVPPANRKRPLKKPAFRLKYGTTVLLHRRSVTRWTFCPISFHVQLFSVPFQQERAQIHPADTISTPSKIWPSNRTPFSSQKYYLRTRKIPKMPKSGREASRGRFQRRQDGT